MARQLLVESIRIDGQTQSREKINEETVAEYAEAMKGRDAKAWPPVTVYFDGVSFWLADGFHRFLAAQKIGKKNIRADVIQGTREDAAWASAGANLTHGLRRTNADKFKAVKMALQLRPETSDSALSDHCGASHTFVAEIRKQVATVATCYRIGKDGKQYALPTKRVAGKGLGPPPRSDEKGRADVTDQTDDTVEESGGVPPSPEEVPEEKPEEKKAKCLVDEMGRRIPDFLKHLWSRRGEVQEMLSALSKVRVALRKAQDCDDPLFSEVPYSSALAHLDQAFDAVQVAKPYAVCAFCQGHGCKACGKRGLLGKFRWDVSVPKEHKEAVARIIDSQPTHKATAGKGASA